MANPDQLHLGTVVANHDYTARNYRSEVILASATPLDEYDTCLGFGYNTAYHTYPKGVCDLEKEERVSFALDERQIVILLHAASCLACGNRKKCGMPVADKSENIYRR